MRKYSAAFDGVKAVAEKTYGKIASTHTLVQFHFFFPPVRVSIELFEANWFGSLLHVAWGGWLNMLEVGSQNGEP